MSKRLIKTLVIAGSLFFAVVGIGYIIALTSSREGGSAKTEGEARLKAKNRALKEKISALTPKGVHIVVDTASNVLLLKNGSQVLRRAVVSSGSGNVLEDPSGKKTWVFDTPRGVYSVKSKAVDPKWIKPDWAFIEEGEEIPSKFKDRVEEGVLGDYALGFGNGYFIHGTLYTRLLGRNVTHGCIRVGDEDLKAVFQSAPPGTKIIIF